MPEFRVYVVELSAAACNRTDCASRQTGKPHVYVGETKKTPEERLADHRAGGFTSRPVVRNHGIGLLPRLYRAMRVCRTRTESRGGGGTARRPAEKAGPLRVRRPLSPPARAREPMRRKTERRHLTTPHSTERSTT